MNRVTAVERIVREEWGQVLATLVGYVRDFDLAEDMLQEACLSAVEHWSLNGIPKQPAGWLFQTAKRRAIDTFRRNQNFESKRSDLEYFMRLEQQSQGEEVDEVESPIPDERLQLLFTCCHPALEEQARVALTLRTLGGLSTSEIARAFLLSESTMAQRLVRAKRKIKVAGIPYAVPPVEQWAERLSSVLSVVYFIFNEGYESMSGSQVTKADLAQEAIRLGRILVDLVPHEPEAKGLLALMLLHDARRVARMDRDGNLVTLERQDRTLWDRAHIHEGLAQLDQALTLGPVGPYQIQAAISAVHVQSTTYEQTDWTQITQLYDKLYELHPTPVVKLNRTIAYSFAKGPNSALKAIQELADEGSLEAYQPFHAARADVFRRAGHRDESVQAYRHALTLTTNQVERRFLEQRLLEILE